MEQPERMDSPRREPAEQHQNTAENWSPERVLNKLNLLRGSTPLASGPLISDPQVCKEAPGEQEPRCSAF